jgi:4-diphosphocytidyl-2-C-methyl-D-erythritol kinase
MPRSVPVAVRAFAKINLDLRILGLLPDGYHEVRTVLQSVRLHDTLTFTPTRGRFVIECDAPGVPLDARNLVWKAAALLDHVVRRRDGDPTGMRVTIVKRIPAEAGLGGGSSDAAATLLALTRLWRLDLDLPSLLRLGARLGADVPFFLAGGTVLGAGRGDDISPLTEAPRVTVVIVKPPFGVSTPDAYRWFDEDGQPRPGRVRRRLPSSWPAWAASVRNDLEAPVGRRHPPIRRAVLRLTALGADHAAMSGSGSAVFGLFERPDTARAAHAALVSQGWRAWVTQTLSRAAVVRERQRVLAGT